MVLSLGKEEGVGRWGYISRFYKYIFNEKYDSVFSHMNQEYILLGGLFWRLAGKRVYMWRNHHAGSLLTDITALLCTKIFCTSKYSYTAKFKKTELMPVGVDTDLFQKLDEVPRVPRSILFLARIAPVKKPHFLIEALNMLKTRNIDFTADIYGDPLPKDEKYLKDLKRKVKEADLGDFINFYPGVPNTETVGVYNSHEIFDKTIFEAMACETLTLATNKNLAELVSESFIAVEDDAENIALKLEKLLAMSDEDKMKWGGELRRIAVEKHSLRLLGNKLADLVL
jgi:glycosyltransferase involved in cell wall biosynthesis